jgi:hypothetical protein
MFGIPAVVAGACVFLALWHRARFGVDFTDESYYASITNKLTRGGTLFVDEFAVQQLGQLLVVPLAWAHRSITGSTQGLILFFRCSYLVTALVLSLIPMFALRKGWGFPTAFLIGLLGVVYIPFNIMAFSYNTLGMQLFSAGLFVGFWARRMDCPYRSCLAFLAGLLLGADLLAYPTLVVPQAIFSLVFLSLERSWRRAFWLVFGGSIFPLAVLGMLGLDGLNHFRQSLSFCTANTIDSSKFFEIWRTLWNWYEYKRIVLLGLLVPAFLLTFAAKKIPLLSISAAALLLIPLPLVKHGICDSMYYVIFFSFTAPFSFAFLWRSQTARDLFCLVWIPSALGGYVTALTSGNGALSMAIGMFPAMLAALALLLLLIRQRIERHSDGQPHLALANSLACFAIPLALVTFFALMTCRSAYRDGPPFSLNCRIDRGPFAGLYTTPERAALIGDITNDLKRVATSEDRVFFFYDFPAGYLLTDLPWASNTSWQIRIAGLEWRGHQRAIEHYWKDPNHQPTLIVKIATCLNQYPQTANEPYPFAAGDPFLDLLKRHFTPVLQHEHFAIFRRTGRP